MLLSFLQATPDCVQIINCNGELEFINANGLSAMEIDDFSPLKGTAWSGLWLQETQDLIDGAVGIAAGGRPTRFEAFCPTSKGNERWWDVTVTPIRNTEGEVERILSVSRDVTALKLEQQSVRQYAEELEDDLQLKREMLDMQSSLIRPIDHRVRNSMAIIAALLKMQADVAGESSVKVALHEAMERIGMVVTLKALLYRGNRKDHAIAKDYLPALAREIIESSGIKGVDLTTYVEPVELDFSRATALGLVLVESLQNAVEHGCVAGQAANIKVKFGHSMGGDLKLVIENDGRPLDPDFDLEAASGLGFRIIGLYAKQLGARFGIQNHAGGGTRFVFRCDKP